MWPNVSHPKGKYFLQTKEILQNETEIFSQNGWFFLKCQGDGKIVLYKAQTPLSTDKPTPYWNNTDKMTKNGPHTLSLQADGNLVLYDKGMKALWASNTNDANIVPCTLTVQYDGNLTYTDKNGLIKWESNSKQSKVRNNVLENDFSLLNKSTLFSPNGTQFAKMQEDGRLVVYKAKNPYATLNATQTWQSSGDAKADGPFRLCQQSDGNLVIYNSKNAAVWATNVSSKDKPFRLEMQDDGNLVTYNKDSKVNWALW